MQPNSQPHSAVPATSCTHVFNADVSRSSALRLGACVLSLGAGVCTLGAGVLRLGAGVLVHSAGVLAHSAGVLVSLQLKWI